jgi:MFS family permease
MMGTFLVLPILPFYAKQLGASAFVYTVLVSAFSLATLLSSPYWGRFSDRYGRRPALLIALGASALAYLVFGFATSLWVLLLSRLIQGAGGGTVGVIQAYLTDVTESKNRAKALGWLSAATNVGVTIGPALSAAAVRLGKVPFTGGPHPFMLGRSAPGILAAAVCVVNMYFVWTQLAESHTARAADRGKGGNETKPPEQSRAVMWRVIRHPNLPSSRLIAIYAVGIGAFYGATSVLAYLLNAKFGITEDNIGWFFTYVGFLSVVTRAVLLGYAIDWLGEARLSRVGTIMLVLGLIFVPLSPNIPWFAVAVSMFPLGTAFMFPCVTAMLSRVIPSDERGVYMGTQQAFGGMARVVFPLVAGKLYDVFNPGAPFWAGAVVVAGTLLLGLDMESYITVPPTEVERQAVAQEAGEPVGQ